MPDRMLRDGWKTSQRIGAISEGAETLLVRLILSACNLSRYHADPQIIKGTAYTNRPRIRTSDIASRLNELETAGLIARYTAPDGTPLLEIPRFGQNLKFGLKSPFAPKPGGPADAPGQTLLGIDSEPEPRSSAPPLVEHSRARKPEKRREEKSPHSPPPAGGEDSHKQEEPGAAPTRRPRRFQSPERRAARIAEIGREIAVIREQMRDIYYPGGCAHKVTPSDEKAAQADKLRARWDALEKEQERLEETPENTGGE